MSQRQQYPSAVRNASFTGDQLNLFNEVGIKAALTVTAVPGVDSVQLIIEENVGTDIGGTPTDNWVQILAAAARTTTGTDVLTVYPGIAVAANVSASYVPASRVRARVAHSGSGNFTYSLRLESLE